MRAVASIKEVSWLLLSLLAPFDGKGKRSNERRSKRHVFLSSRFERKKTRKKKKEEKQLSSHSGTAERRSSQKKEETSAPAFLPHSAAPLFFLSKKEKEKLTLSSSLLITTSGPQAPLRHPGAALPLLPARRSSLLARLQKPSGSLGRGRGALRLGVGPRFQAGLQGDRGRQGREVPQR